ncbi:MAG: ABC transporter permease [Thermomicrobiales bacterium]|nr:ABC transporter permease [Thermomicrobiales bacterium]MCO5221849.1 ABC transporter permease [Thermomicrobiales bacterium]
MGRYILGRLLSLIFVLFAVSLIAFLLMHAVPGGPFDIGERRLPEATRQAQLAKYGLDKPIYEQYVRYMWHAIQGDFGVPFQRPTETVTGLIASRWPVTIAIGIPTILIAYIGGTVLGTIAATRQNSWIDYLVTTLGTLGLTVPSWVVGTWLVLILSVRWDLLPTGGWGSWKHYIMPVIAYSLAPMALVARYTRLTLIETMRSDYVRTARAKGLGERRIMLGHIFRNAAIPWVTVLLPEIPNILTGSIFIEAIFNIPGLGSYFVTSTISRDYPMILALTLLIATLWGVTYLITDILYTVLDPRVRLVGGRAG